MIYNSIDTIPAKLFFKIVKSGDTKLLAVNENEIDVDELEKIWNRILEEDSKITENKEESKVLNISKKIESTASKLEKVKLAIFYLSVMADDEIIEMLKKDGYTFSGDLKKDLEKIERFSEALKIKIDKYSNDLNDIIKKDSDEDSEVPFDEVVLSYGVITGIVFKTNEITLSEYRALIKIGNKKMKVLESNGKGK